MDYIIKNIKFNAFAICIILILTFSRLIPHPPNFTPIISVAIMSGYLLKNLNLAFIVLIISMLTSDLLIGFHGNMLFVYLPLFLIAYLFFKISDKVNTKNLLIYSLLGSFIFFIFSNFGVWYFSTIYENNLSGLINCYIMAIPFFKNTLISTILFSYSALFANSFSNKLLLKN